MKARILSGSIGLLATFCAATALAEAPKDHVVTLRYLDLVIVGRLRTPLAAVEVARAEQNVPLPEIAPPFASRIERAVTRDPY